MPRPIVRILLEGLTRINLGQAVREAQIHCGGELGSRRLRFKGMHKSGWLIFCSNGFATMEEVHALAGRCDRSGADRDRSDSRLISPDLVAKMKALESVTTKPEFDPLIVGFKRAHRLVEKEQWDRKPVDRARFEHPTESALYQATAKEREKMISAMTRGEYGQALDALVRLKPAIDAFFAAVMVNAEDPAVRSNRLSLLQEIDDFFNSFADFSQIVVQGG